MKFRLVLSALAVAALSVAGAMSGPQATLAMDIAPPSAAGMTLASEQTTVEGLLRFVVGTASNTRCDPSTGRCCTYNPQDPKGECVQADPCQSDPDLCEPPAATSID